MGATVSSFLSYFYSKSDIRICMYGLDDAGKTALLYKLKLGEFVDTNHTIGFNVETIIHQNINFIIWELSGYDRMRPLWHHFYENIQAVIFVIDSTDRERIEEAEWEIKRFFCRYEGDNTILLVLANKQDLPNVMTVEEITSKLRLYELPNRKWHIQPTSAKNGNGLLEAMDWLVKELAISIN